MNLFPLLLFGELYPFPIDCFRYLKYGNEKDNNNRKYGLDQIYCKNLEFLFKFIILSKF